MATSLCSALALVTLLQAPPPALPPADSLATLRGRTERDSTDAQLWLLMGRAYLGLGLEAHGATHRSSEDSAWTRAVLDTAEEALGRAAALAGPLGSSAVGDSARVLRVGAWAARSWLGWEAGGVGAGVETWGPLPMDLHVPPVLDELGENLPLCVSMAFERPPETRPRIRWETRPLVWVAGPEGKSPRVPPRDFVFGALRVALDASDPWAELALAAYTRAARTTPALCEAMATFRVSSEVGTCRR